MTDEDSRIDLDLDDIVRAAAPDAEIVVLDGESVDSAADYRAVLEALDRISGGALDLQDIRATDGDPREVVVLRRGRDELTLGCSSSSIPPSPASSTAERSSRAEFLSGDR